MEYEQSDYKNYRLKIEKEDFDVAEILRKIENIICT